MNLKKQDVANNDFVDLNHLMRRASVESKWRKLFIIDCGKDIIKTDEESFIISDI